MTKNDINVALIVILETLSEGRGEAPSGYIYAALQTSDPQTYTLSAYTWVLSVLTRSDLVTLEDDVVTITAKGRELAGQIAAARRA